MIELVTPASNDRLGQLPVQLSVRVCQRSLSLNQFLQWSPGMVIEFDQSPAAPLTLKIDQKTVGTGVAVKIGSQLGLCLQKIGEQPN